MPASPTSPHRPDDGAALSFASFTLDRRRGQLTNAGAPVPLRPKTWSVLVYLAERPGTLVTREELLDAVWPDVAVTPDTLTKSIGELRIALGDDSRQPRFIETVHRRGFRFLDTPQPLAAVAAPSGDGPFVGRAAELQRLAGCLAAARRGERQLVFVSGQAGVGKTALLETFLRGAAIAQPATVVATGACITQHGEHEAYLPVLEAVERLARGPEAVRVAALLRGRAPSWLAQMPWLAGEDAPPPPAARPERMLREGVALLEGLAEETTVVLALEDLHWSDPSTVDLLARLGQRREPARLLVLVSYRPAEVAVHEHPLGHALRVLRGQRRGVELPLHELSGAAVLDYLDARFPGASVPAGLAAALHQHTDGHPLFLRAVVDHLVARGWILDTAPGWSFAALPSDAAFGVPDDARDMIGLQIDSLAPADRRVLEAAGVAGRNADVALLAAVLGRDEDAVEQSCETLARAERFLRPAGEAEAPRYAFVHELYRQAIYRDTPAARRQRLHRAIAAALETRLGARAADQAAALAHHCEHGGEPERAIAYLCAAAGRARQRGAPREAGGHLDHALTLLPRLASPEARRRRELELRIAQAPVEIERFGAASTELLAVCERALALCDDADEGLRFSLVYALCHVRGMRGDPAALQPATDALDALADRLGPTQRLLADSLLCRAVTYQARYADARRLAARVLSAAAAGVSPADSFGSDPVIAARNHQVLSAWLAGDLADARAGARALEERAASAAPFSRTSAAFFLCLLAHLERDPTLVVARGATVLALTEEHGFAQWGPMADALRGWVEAEAGAPAAAVATLREARAAYATSGAITFSVLILALLGVAEARAGELDAAQATLDDALRLTDAGIDAMWLPDVWCARAEMLFARGRVADGEAALRRAIDVAGEQAARMPALRASLVLAQRWAADGRDGEARGLVEAALAGIDGDADHPDLRAARALLAVPAGRRPARRRR